MATATDSRMSPENGRLMAWLKTQRIEKGLNMRELGARLGVAHSRIGKYETLERRLDVAEYFEVCGAIGCDPYAGLRHAMVVQA